MVHIHNRAKAEVPAEFAFDYVTNFDHLHEWMFGLQEIKAVGSIARGLGAVYEATVKIGVKLQSRVEVIGWEPGRSMTMESRAGIVNRSTWQFESLGPDQTAVVVDVHYALPGGLAGKALGKAIEPFMGMAVRQSDEQLRARLEARYRRERGPAQEGGGQNQTTGRKSLT